MKRDLRLATFLILLVCVSVALLTAWQIWTARQNTLSDIRTDTLNLTHALNTYTEGTFKQSEVLLLGLTERIEKDGSGPQQLERLNMLIEQEMDTLPQLNSVVLYDAQGDWIFSTSRPFFYPIVTTPIVRSSSITATFRIAAYLSARRFSAEPHVLG